MAGPAVEFRVLGELAVQAGGREIDPGPHKRRLVLALLLCRANSVVSTDLLTEAVWGDEPPRTARKNLQVHVSALRALLPPASPGGAPRIVHRPAGYQLRVEPDELDLLCFERLVHTARKASGLAAEQAGQAASGVSEHAARLLDEALALWRGDMLADLGDSGVIREEADRWSLRRLAVCEDWAETSVALGRHTVVADRLADTVRAHPLRERLLAVHMTALHRSGRRTEALACYDEYRKLLAAELGLDVGPAVTAVHRSLLASAAASPAPLAEWARERPRRGAAPRTRLLLPAALDDFTGRSAETAQLLDAVGTRRRSVQLSGPLGVGKTSLAVHVAHRMAPGFPDGCLLIRMRRPDGTPRPVPSLLAELRRITGTNMPPPVDEDDAVALWQAELLDRALLLVLDDAPDAASVRPLLPGSGDSAAVVTTRCGLPGIGSPHRVELGPYPLRDAVEFLGGLVGAHRVLADRAAAERIVAAVGLLPLTIRLYGGKLAALRHVSLPAYASRLERGTAILDELATADPAVRPLLAGWWRDLPAPARDTLAALGRLPGPLFTLADAAEAMALPEDHAYRLLELLLERRELDSQLAEVTAHTTLYELPLLSHLYAREQAMSARA
ncbi:AfsR/SARP family transcriptional regulator [Streptomyces montanisoli]|uniref:AfsR/SARP family transcriptional regulator n=1 Tax=Streptomyces montanisoli TaxID=2798581 RepID=A0A940MGG3_9ACTN|nr:AfsR/SARP family transcriptional regulator [Streptomyces montanisoli]MBP0458746.1 AfsR/SARP family transcriptional regulator [Streptomyces montanisoli]